MSAQEEMHSLTQDIIGSFEVRAQGVAHIRQAAATQLRELSQAHQALARRLRADLAQAETSRQAQTHSRLKEMTDRLRADLVQGRADLASSVASQLKELDAAHAGARGEWHNLTITMQAKRAAPSTKAKAPPPAAGEGEADIVARTEVGGRKARAAQGKSNRK